MAKLLVYKLISKLALWTGCFYTCEQHRFELEKQKQYYENILLDKKKCDWFRLSHQALEEHKTDMLKAFII